MDMPRDFRTVSTLFTENSPRNTLAVLVCSILAVYVFLSNGAVRGVKRIGKSRLRTLLTGETPLRFDLEKYGYLGYQQVYHISSHTSQITDSLQFSKQANKPFLVKIYGLDHYVLPAKYLDSLKAVDHHKLSFAQSLNDVS
jgi:hypothetical protein